MIWDLEIIQNAIKLEIAWTSKDKSLACKLEYQIKNLTKQQKENKYWYRNILNITYNCRMLYTRRNK